MLVSLLFRIVLLPSCVDCLYQPHEMRRSLFSCRATKPSGLVKGGEQCRCAQIGAVSRLKGEVVSAISGRKKGFFFAASLLC